MPPNLPPTPATSGELSIKDSIDAMSEHSFVLPPAALSPIVTDESGSSRKGSMVFQAPVSPTSPDLAALGSRRASTASTSRAGTKRGAATALDEFNLPPPPTRTRKIIQMKPKTSSSSTTPTTSNSNTTQSPQKGASKGNANTKMSTTAANTASATQPPTANGNKKKQPSATSAAGRKIARKTAHSLIERRRRSKMNEEFATLKNMIPACQGQEMHKLAILQASIDYMNYLEQCIAELKSASSGKHTQATMKPVWKAPPGPPSPTSPELYITERAEEEPSSASTSTSPSLAATTSPAFSPHTGPVNPHQSQSMDSSFYPILPSPALGPLRSPRTQVQQNTWRQPPQPLASATPSPAILPQQHRHSISSSYASSTTSAAPALENDSMIDHEASAALLMLNMDRRGTTVEESAQRSSLTAEASARERRKMGMSVRDLLTS